MRMHVRWRERGREGEIYFGGLSRAAKRGEDEVEKLLAEFRVGVAEEADARGAVGGSDADDGRIET